MKAARRETCDQTRTIFCFRCAAYLRLLPRTRLQQNRLSAQTHSRRRAMLASPTKIILPSVSHVSFLRRHTILLPLKKTCYYSPLAGSGSLLDRGKLIAKYIKRYSHLQFLDERPGSIYNHRDIPLYKKVCYRILIHLQLSIVQFSCPRRARLRNIRVERKISISPLQVRRALSGG